MNDYSCLEKQFKRLPNELRLILACLRKGMHDGCPDLCSGWIDRGINWDVFFDFARHHGVYPKVYDVLRTFTPQPIPNSILAKLQLLYKKNSLDMMNLTGELLRLTTLFRQHGIRIIVLKGPALAKQVYGRLSMRTSTDLDLLAAGDDIPAIEEILFSEGYDSVGRSRNLTAKEHAFFRRFTHHYVYRHKNTDIPIEVHWRLSKQTTGFFAEDHFDTLWRQRQILFMENAQVFTLSTMDNCLYLMVHGAFHGWLRLQWLYDITLLLNNESSLTTESLMTYAGNFGLQTIAGQALILSKTLFETAPADTLKPITGPKRAIGLCKQVIACLAENLNPSTMKPFSRELYRHIRYTLGLFNSKAARIHFLLNHFRPTFIDYQTLHLPDSCFPFYYVLRPFLLVFRQIKKKSVSNPAVI